MPSCSPRPCPLPHRPTQILGHPIFARLVEAASQRAAEMSDAELTGVLCCTVLLP